MTALCPAAAAASARFRPGVGGFTLLEVLVSLGIIIGALAGIAALLPAAGARLGEATETDRAGTMAANARADLANRRVITSGLWSGVTTPAVVFGEGLSGLATLAPASSSVGVANLGGQAPGFVLEDSTVGGGAPGICYGCMVSATTPPGGLTSGSAVRLTTVVFRQRGPDMKAFTLTQTGSGSNVFTSGSGADAAADRRRFLGGCSWVLVMSGSSATVPPRWFPVASSWTAYPTGTAGAVTTSATGASFVSLSGTECLQLLSSSSSTTLQAIGFDGLLRLDERTVTLE